jgi:hypothetical protein
MPLQALLNVRVADAGPAGAELNGGQCPPPDQRANAGRANVQQVRRLLDRVGDAVATPSGAGLFTCRPFGATTIVSHLFLYALSLVARSPIAPLLVSGVSPDQLVVCAPGKAIA